MAEKHWQLVEEEALVSFVNIKEKKAYSSRFYIHCLALLFFMFIGGSMLHSEKRSNIDTLKNRYSNRTSFSSGLYNSDSPGYLKRSAQENILEKNQIDDSYRGRYVAVVILFALFGFLFYYYYLDKKKSLKDIKFVYVKGAVAELDRYEVNTESGTYSKHQVSIILANGDIVRKIEVNDASGIELGETVVIIREQGSERLPEIYAYAL